MTPPSPDDIPPYGTASYGDAPPDRPAAIASDEIQCLKARTFDRLARCIARLTGEIGRDWLRCGKAACARSRRCRGYACEPDGDDE
jgi:hypothetical protein